MLSSIALCVILGPAKLPTTEAEIVGNYCLSTGYEITQYRLKPGGRLEISHRFDHPGEKVWVGTWRFQEGMLQVLTHFKRQGKPMISEFLAVPILWGDRLMLASPDELLDGTIRKELSRVARIIKGRTALAGWEIRLLTREVPAKGVLKFAPVYGLPLAPKPFDECLPGTNLK